MHNKAGHCSANVIQVSSARSEIFCDTYIKADAFGADQDAYDQYAAFVSRSGVEFGEDMESNPKVTCNVNKCVFNRSFHCSANDLQISGTEETIQSRCKTYRPK